MSARGGHGALLLLALLLAGAAGCRYENNPPNGAQLCARAPAKRCPDGYACRDDNRCWRNGTGPGDGGTPDLPLSDARPDLPDAASSDGHDAPGDGRDAGDGDTNLDGGGCADGGHMCSGACVSNVSVDHCGLGCMPCSAPDGGTATCNGTACDFTCPTPMRKCGATCISGCCTAADCPPGDGGTVGQCDTSSHACSYACPSGQKPCNGVCIPSANCCTAADCGAPSCTGLSFQGPGTCTNGTCSRPAAQTCPFVCTTAGCTGSCVPNTPRCNAGIPQICDGNGNYQNKPACTGGFTCAAGSCTCAAPLTACGGGTTCVDTRSDNSNCGACGTICAANQTCVSGTCRFKDAQPCSVGSQCVSGTCNIFYRDDDGDGYGGPADGYCTITTPPAGHVAAAGDCCDNGGNLAMAALIHPNAGYQTTAATICGVTWDYDCDGAPESDSPVLTGCTPAPECKSVTAPGDPANCGKTTAGCGCGVTSLGTCTTGCGGTHLIGCR